jgi:hypothetical protein
MTQGTIYLIGVFLLGISQDWLRHAVGGFVFLSIIFGYLLVLVAIAEKFGKRDK